MKSKKILQVFLISFVVLISFASAYAGTPKVIVLGTGGTIQSKGDTRMTRYDYRAGRFDIAEIIDLIPQVKEVAELEAEQFTNIGSSSMTPDIWKGLAERINETALRPDVSGFVLTHGTNTLEETAYFLHLTVQTDKPVVIVGAQRPSTSISADGPMNFYNAVQVAASPDARDKGVLICMNQQINSAREGTKTSAYKVEAFQSRDLGLLGVVDPDGVHFLRAPVRRHTYLSEFDVSDISSFPRIDIIPSFADAAGDLITFLASAGTAGIVLAGHGAGGASPAQGEAFKTATSNGVIAIACSRTGSGRVIESSRMLEYGLIAGDNLLPHKARILLMLAIASGKSERSELIRIFDQY